MFKMLILPIALAGTPNADVGLMTGIGVSSCATFAQEYARNPSIGLTYFAWAEGYMTGSNISDGAHTGKARILARNAQSLTDQENELRRYCDQHPLADYIDGVIELYKSLPFYDGQISTPTQK